MFVPVSILLDVQCKNYCLNKTTNERFAKKVLSSFSDDGDSLTSFEKDTDFLMGGGIDSPHVSLIEDNE